MITTYFRHPSAVTPNVIALSYTVLGYAVGVWLLTADAWWVNALGVLLTAHTLVYAAYFIHEFAHQSIFKTAEANNGWGTLMTWITGSCYATFAALRRKHMRHHIDRADIITFDYKAFLRRSPSWVSKVVVALEWAYVPAVELIMHGYIMIMPFVRDTHRNERSRVTAVFLTRAALFGALGWYAPKALLLYMVSYFIMLHALRFADAFQHTYDVFEQEGAEIPNDKVRDREYEQTNTYSNVVSLAHPWLNVLYLNFAFHNAHHERPIAPWHDLPQLHQELFGDHYEQVIPMWDLIRNHHRYRTVRVLSDDYGSVGTGKHKANNFYGAYGVSFLTAA